MNDRAADASIKKDRVAKDRVAKDRVTKDRVTKDRVTKDRVTKDRVAMGFWVASGLLILMSPHWVWAQDPPRILDPQEGAYVSGEYQVVAEIDDSSHVSATALYVDGIRVWQGSGWQSRLSHDFGGTIDAHELVVEVTGNSGQTTRSSAVRTQALRVDVVETSRMILIPTMVTSGSNKPITGLDRDSFEVFEDNKVIEIQTFFTQKVPLELALMLDTSSSMRQDIEALKHAAIVFLQSLEPSDQVLLYEIKNEPIKLRDFSTDRKSFIAEVESLTPIGQTALFQALQRGMDDLGVRRRSRRAVVLFTDGRDSVFESPEKKAFHLRAAITTAQNKETVIYTIGLGRKINRGALERLAEETGGRFLYVPKASHLREAFEEVVLDLKHQYVLGVVPRASNSGFHSLDVRVKKRGAEVRARKGYTLE